MKLRTVVLLLIALITIAAASIMYAQTYYPPQSGTKDCGMYAAGECTAWTLGAYYVAGYTNSTDAYNFYYYSLTVEQRATARIVQTNVARYAWTVQYQAESQSIVWNQ